MRNCLCSCPALSDASDTFERTYHVYAVPCAGETDVVRALARSPNAVYSTLLLPFLLLFLLFLFASCSTSLFLRPG